MLNFQPLEQQWVFFVTPLESLWQGGIIVIVIVTLLLLLLHLYCFYRIVIVIFCHTPGIPLARWHRQKRSSQSAGRPQGRYYRPLVNNRPFCLNGWYSWICGRCYIKMVDNSSKSQNGDSCYAFVTTNICFSPNQKEQQTIEMVLIYPSYRVFFLTGPPLKS